MYSLEKDTLAYQLKSRPGTLYRDMSDVNVVNVAKAVTQFMNLDHESDTKPEVDALWFYLTNHAVADVRARFDEHEPLGEFLPLIEEYHKVLNLKTVRMFYYLLMICSREARHMHGDTIKADLGTMISPPFQKFIDTIAGKGSDGAVDSFKNGPPVMPIGDYTRGLVHCFDNGSWSHGYGGKAWGKVAHCLNEFIHGRYSAEMMMDTAFTLSHNNGPIFNKAMFYANYNKHQLLKILDVQRSGQIPQMIANVESPYVHADHTIFQEKAGKLLGATFKGYVDWYLVEDLGSENNYPSEKEAQKTKHGLPASIQKKQMQEQKVKLMKEMQEAKKKADEEAEWLIVMPGVKVKKIQVRIHGEAT